MAAKAKKLVHKRDAPVVLPTSPQDRDDVRRMAARFYAQGKKRTWIARQMTVHLITELMRGRPEEQQLAAARVKLRAWERQPSFRDLVWEEGLTKLDLEGPKIMEGVAKQAKRGKVDAARLAFEITGRHNPKGESAPTQIAIIVDGVPRPGRVQAVEAIEALEE